MAGAFCVAYFATFARAHRAFCPRELDSDVRYLGKLAQS
jgi:hypothetical protein